MSNFRWGGTWRSVGGRFGPASSRQRLHLIGALLTVLAGAIAVFMLVLPVTPARVGLPAAVLIGRSAFWRELAALPVVPSGGTGVAILLLGSTAVAFGAYGMVLLVTWRRATTPPLRRLLIAASILLMGLGVLAPPTAGSDMYDYIGFGRVAAVHHADPYEVGPAAFPADPLTPYVSENYGRRPDNKLPAWQLINEGLARVGGDDPVRLLLLYRAVLVSFGVATLLLIDRVAARVAPAHRLTALATWGLNPVVLVNASAKTDVVMAMFLVAAVALIVSDRQAWAAPAFAASVFVKLITAPMFAIWWIGELRHRHVKQALVIGGFFTATVALFYLRYGLSSDLLIEHLALRRGGGSGPARAAVTRPAFQSPVLTAILAIGTLVLGLLQNGDRRRLIRSFAIVGLYTSAFLTPRAFAWYLLVMIAMVALSAEPRLLAGAFVLSGALFVQETWSRFGSKAHPLPGLSAVESGPIFLIGGSLTLGVLAASAAWTQVRRRGAA